jgi:hypothetical protein
MKERRSKEMGTLSKEEIERHFAEDLPYRTGILLAH